MESGHFWRAPRSSAFLPPDPLPLVTLRPRIANPAPQGPQPALFSHDLALEVYSARARWPPLRCARETREETNVHPSSARSLRAAAERLRRGELVAFPTETVYGLGANALDAKAVARIFEAKGRPQDNPVIVHVSDMKMLGTVVRGMPALASKLIERFWPGPLDSRPFQEIFSPLSRHRRPRHRCRADAGRRRARPRPPAGVPIAAPSANVSGRPSPTTARHVAEDFPDVFVLDGGSTKHGVESTVVALGPPSDLRQGAVREEFLRKMIPGLRCEARNEERGSKRRRGGHRRTSKVIRPQPAPARSTRITRRRALSPSF